MLLQALRWVVPQQTVCSVLRNFVGRAFQGECLHLDTDLCDNPSRR